MSRCNGLWHILFVRWPKVFQFKHWVSKQVKLKSSPVNHSPCIVSPIIISIISSIIGGTEAQRNQFPYQVAIFVYLPTAQSFCSGSILSANFVLSAAHCFYDFESADLLAGVHDIVNDYTGWEMEVFPNDIIRHAQHNRQTNLNDIALVRTSRKPIIFNATLQTIPLIARSYASTDLTNTVARIAGW